jgi:hypothetical protein
MVTGTVMLLQIITSYIVGSGSRYGTACERKKWMCSNLVDSDAFCCGTGNATGHSARYGMIRNHRVAAVIGLLIFNMVFYHAAN